jgi:hypothetical protein
VRRHRKKMNATINYNNMSQVPAKAGSDFLAVHIRQTKIKHDEGNGDQKRRKRV